MMRNRNVVVLAGLMAAVLLVGTAVIGWHFHRVRRQEALASLQKTTTMQLTGTAGGQFTGYYIVNGKRIDVSGTLPQTFSEAGVWQCEFRKVNLNDTLTLEARDGHSYLNCTAAAGTRGIRANTKTGWNVTTLVE